MTAALTSRSPYAVTHRFRTCDAVLDYGREPMLGDGETLPLTLRLREAANTTRRLDVHWDLPGGLAAVPAAAVAQAVKLPAGGSAEVKVTLTAMVLPEEVLRCRVRLTEAGRELGRFDFSVLGRLTAQYDDLALASKGASATSDSELERETDCTAEAIDGIIAGPEDFENRRWHSALTPHPHWLAIDLGKTCTVSRVTVHFADPEGLPVDFDGEGSADGRTWTPLFSRRGYGDTRRCDASFPATPLRHLRLTILKSASTRWPGASQVSEVEVLP